MTRYSVYDVSGWLVSIDQAGAGSTEYIRASGMVLARVAGAAVTWLHPDHLGSAVAGTGAAGSVVWRESEQPFGEDWISAPANDNQAGYTGHVEDAATGLVYMQARYYNPVTGRFLANDPVRFSPARPDMFNRYAYAANDPVNAWDPDGRSVYTKVIKFVINGGDAAATFAGTVSDFNTLTAKGSSPLARGIAVANLASELAPVSTRDIGEAGEFVGKGIKALGDWGENEAAKDIVREGGEIIGRQVPLSTGSKADIVYQDKNGLITCCEVKAGTRADTAPLSERQRTSKDKVNSGETVTTDEGVKIDRYEERRIKIEIP